MSKRHVIQPRSALRSACSLLSLLLPISLAATTQPNVLLIMSDDMGFSDVGSYGSEIETPHLDSLAQNGLRFTQFYNTARCCPTRAALLTGLYPHQAGVGHMMKNYGHDGYRGNLSKQTATIAEVLREGGYRTYMAGKWHLSHPVRARGDSSNWPAQRGFEKYYGTIKGGGSFFDPTSLCRQNTFITPENDPEYQPEEFYYTDALSDNAVMFLQQHDEESPDQPFFMYVAYTAPHWPLHAPEKDIAKYKGKYDEGFEPIRRARFERLKELGLIDRKAVLPPPPIGWEEVEDKAWEARNMEVYAAMIDNMDQGIGRIVGQLEKSGRLENTLILYLHDNGGCAEHMGRHPHPPNPKRELKPFGPDDHQPNVWPPMQTRDGRWVRRGPGVMAGAEDTYIAYGEGWANVSNTPFREYKHWVHEGGITTPLIAHWPGGIHPRRLGKLESQPGHLIDIMATVLDISGVPYPAEFNGAETRPLEGVTLQPAFKGRSLKRREAIFWEHESNRAVRDGKWKLVAKEDEPWELYNMQADRTEMNDLAARHPRRVRELAAKWDAWAARADVLPLGAWRGPQASNQN